MTSQNSQARPPSIQTPGYSVQNGHDLPTGVALADVDENLQAVLQLPPFGSDNALFRKTINSDDQLLPLPHKPKNTCYRNSALAVLFNVSPFLNFLDLVAQQSNQRNSVLNSLKLLADTFRGTEPGDSLRIRRRKLRARMNSFWVEVTTRIQDSNGYLNLLRQLHTPSDDGMDDPNDLILYLFPRIVDSDLAANQVGPDGINLCTVFERFFRYAAIPRTAFPCECGTKHRQSTATPAGNPLEGYTLSLNFETVMKLEEAISNRMWDDAARTRTCTGCGNQYQTNDFIKLAYLPEVFFFPISYLRFNSTQMTNVDTARVEYPGILDMSKLRDDPTRPADQEHCSYKLQSMVLTPNTDVDGSFGTHYTACLRRTDTVWERLDDIPIPNGSKSRVSFEEIEQEGHRPHLLIYVRERPCEHNAGETGVDLNGAEHGQNGNGDQDGDNSKTGNGNQDGDNNKEGNGSKNGTGKNGGDGSEDDSHDENNASSDNLDTDPHNIDRFLAAQNRVVQGGMSQFEQALTQLEKGRKTSHWMWYIFPQVFGLSTTKNGTLYGIKSLAEARDYFTHKFLNTRLVGVTQAVVTCGETDLVKIFGTKVDADKFHASVTLFAYVCDGTDEDVFQRAIDRLCDGRRDERTLATLRSFSEAEADTGTAQGAPQQAEGGNNHTNSDEHDQGQDAPSPQPAIPTDPNDNRIAACQTWTLVDFKEPFRTEGLEYRGLKNTARNKRTRFLQHFDVPRNYDIYARQRLQQAYTSLYPDDSRDLSRQELVAALRAHDDKVVSPEDHSNRGDDGQDEGSSSTPQQGEKRGRDDEESAGGGGSRTRVRRKR